MDLLRASLSPQPQCVPGKILNCDVADQISRKSLLSRCCVYTHGWGSRTLVSSNNHRQKGVFIALSVQSILFSIAVSTRKRSRHLSATLTPLALCILQTMCLKKL